MKVLLIAAIMLVAMTTGLMALTVEGTVTDSETGEGIEGATVRFVYVLVDVPDVRGNGSGGGNAYNVSTTVTDANGHYFLENLQEGTYNVVARKIGEYPSVKIEGVEFTGDTIYDFELIPGDCEPTLMGSSFLKFGN